MNYKKIILLLCFSWVFSGLSAQTVLLERNTQSDTVPKVFGKNKKVYFGTLLGLGFHTGASGAGLPVKFFSSNEFMFGFWGMRKLSKRFSLGMEANFKFSRYVIAQNDDKKIPDVLQYEDERYIMPHFNPNLFFRTRLNRFDGSKFGTYFDLGVGLNIPFTVTHQRTQKDPATNNNVETNRTNLSYIQPVQVTSMVRLGYRSVSIYGMYRLTEPFKKEPAEKLFNQSITLPPITVGIQLIF